MTTTEIARGTPRGWSERWSPLGGLAFVVGTIVVLILNPDAGETPEAVIAAAKDKGTTYTFMAVFALLSIPLLLWFVSGLYVRLRRLESHTAPTLVLAGGLGFSLLLFTSFTVSAAPLLDFPGKADSTAAANAYLTFDDFGWTMLGGAGVSFALMAVAASIVALKSRAVPAWLGWLGAIVGLAAAATITFWGVFAWILWILVASILLLFRPAE